MLKNLKNNKNKKVTPASNVGVSVHKKPEERRFFSYILLFG